MMRATVTSFAVLVLVCLMVVQPVVAQTCQPGVTFVADVTVPDDTVYQPDAPFEKIWRLRNSGTCDWNDNYSLTFVDGDQLGAESPQRLGRTVAVGDATDIGVVMRAPASPGTYTSRWQVQDDTGKRFGDPFYVRIRVTQVQEPQAEIASPEPGAIVAGQVPVTGSAIHPAFDYYKLEVGPGETPPDDQMGLITDLIRDQVLSGQLGSWDTTSLNDGIYSLRLRVVDRNGNYQEFWVKNLTVSNAAPPPPTKRAATPVPTQQPTATLTPPPTETAVPLPTVTPTTAPQDLGFSGASVKQTPVPPPTQPATATPLPTATATPLPTATLTPLPTATFTPLPTATAKPVELIAIPPVSAPYQNADWGVSFLYPQGWVIDDQSSESSFNVNGGPSQEAMSVFGPGVPTEVLAPVFGIMNGLVSELPNMPPPDATGHVPAKDVLEAFVALLGEQYKSAGADLTQVGEIRPIQAAEIEGSMVEMSLPGERGRMTLAAFVVDDLATILIMMAPEAQQAEVLKLTEDMAASLRLKPPAGAETPTASATPTMVPTATLTPLPTATAKPVEIIAIPPVNASYQNADWGISFLYPEGWVIEDESSGSSYLSVKGGSSQEAMSVFEGDGFPSEISAPAFGVTGGPISDLPDMPTPDASGQVPVKGVLEGFISLVQSAVTEGEVTQVGEIRPVKAAEIEGSMAELLLSDKRSRMNLAAFAVGDMATVLMVMAPEAQQAEALKLTEDMAASMQFKPLAGAETPAALATTVVVPTATTALLEEIAIPPLSESYKNDAWGISLLYPKGWLTQEDSSDTFFSLACGPSEDALAVFEGALDPTTLIPAPVLGVMSGPASDIPNMPAPDAAGRISTQDALKGFISFIGEEFEVAEAPLTPIGEIYPVQASGVQGSGAEVVFPNGQGRVFIAAFAPGDIVTFLLVMIPEAGQAETRRLFDDVLASLRIEQPAAVSPTSALVTSAPTEIPPTEAPTAASGGFGFTAAGGDETPTPAPAEAPTAASGFGFTAETPAVTTPTVPPVLTVEVAGEPRIDLQVVSYRSYTDTYGYMYVVGEIVNAGNVPVWDVKTGLSLLDEQGNEIGVEEYNTILLDILPVDGHYPFKFSIDKEMQNWKTIKFKTEARPYEPQAVYYKPSESLLVANMVAHEAVDKYDTFSLTGKVVNKGDVAAGSVRIAIIAYDTEGKVVDTNGTLLSMDLIPPDGAMPFDLSLYGIAETPPAYEILVQGREDTQLAEEQAQVPLEVASYTNYMSRFDRLIIAGEAINTGAVPAKNIKIAVATLDDNGDVLAMSTANWPSLELVPPGGKYPFAFEFGDDAKDWKEVEIQVQAQPYDPETSYFKPHGSLKVEGVTGAVPESDWGGYKLSGQVLNEGDVAATWVKVVVIAYDAAGAVVDVNSTTPKIDGNLLPGDRAPFELEFRGLKEEPASYQTFVQGREAE